MDPSLRDTAWHRDRSAASSQSPLLPPPATPASPRPPCDSAAPRLSPQPPQPRHGPGGTRCHQGKGRRRGWVQRWVIPLCGQAPHGRAHLCLSALSEVPCEGTLIGDTPAHGTGSWAMAAPCDDSRQPQLLGPGEFLLWSYFCIASKFTRETLHLSGAAPSCLLQSATGETAHPAWGGPRGQAGIPWGTAAFPQLRPSRGKGKQPCCTPSSSWAAPTLKQPYPVFCFFFFP